MATLPGGGPAEDGSEFRSHACGVAKVEARGHAPGVGRIVIVTVTPPRGTPVPWSPSGHLWGSGVPSTRSQFWALGRAFEHA
jgi:hypothetical protein